MAKLSLYLPPFAGDYSGACSTLFGLDCLVIVIDAGCCTRTYVEYDELRWSRRRKSTFSAQLRTLDAVLGDDERILEQAIEAAEALRPACIALVGTPVPAIVGMDLAGMAHEVEARCGVPSFGLPTTGFETYERGASLVLAALCGRFALEGAPTASFGAPGARPRVNLLGVTPHDCMGEEHAAALEACVREQGFEVAWSTAGSYALEDVAAASRADASLVVAWSGLAAARLLRDRCGVPFATGFPAGSVGVDALGAALRAAMAGKRAGVSPPVSGAASDAVSAMATTPVLVVGEQVAANALRGALRARFARVGAVPPVHVASFFAMEPAWMEPGDRRLETEADLARYAEEHSGLRCVGDPLLRRVPGLAAAPLLELPHEAVSSTLYAQDASLPGAAMDGEIDAFVERCTK